MEAVFTAIVKRWGNSLVIVIPQDVRSSLKLRKGSVVKVKVMKVENGGNRKSV